MRRSDTVSEEHPMVRKVLIVATLLTVASPLAAQDDYVWTSKRPDGHAPMA